MSSLSNSSSSNSSSSRGSSRNKTNTEESKLMDLQPKAGISIFIPPPIRTDIVSDNNSPRTINLPSIQPQQVLPPMLAPSQNSQITPPPITTSQIPPPPPIATSQIPHPPILNSQMHPLPNSSPQIPPFNQNAPHLPPLSNPPYAPPQGNIGNPPQMLPIQVFLPPPVLGSSYQTYNSQNGGYTTDHPEENPEILISNNHGPNQVSNPILGNSNLANSYISHDPSNLASSYNSAVSNRVIEPIIVSGSVDHSGQGYQSNSIFQNANNYNYNSDYPHQPHVLIQPPMIYQPPCSENQIEGTVQSSINEENLHIIKLSRLCRVLIIVRICLILIYMIPVFYILPLLLFEIIGYLGARNLKNCLNVGYTVYLSISLLVRTIIIIAFGVATRNQANGNINYSILILVLVVFIIVEFFEIVQLYFEAKLSVQVGKNHYETNGRIVHIMRTTKWFSKT
ncbi:hypothetical protein SteCoe_20801 [Stentor coeruleus]|uniref:Uncharacterized protein n=1 Tax=Stentor coeruleus TaxID=5963 RepID=A0A1R2BR48_9CILI|nr:hypothetical protein SteCoe_20801 [Stentor coeruleus]